MKAKELQSALDMLASKGQWLMSTNNIKTLFPDESNIRIMKSLQRHTETGLILRVCRGLYANDRALCKPSHPLEALVDAIRPMDFSYLSAETVLSEAGVISQMPNSLIVMTTGRSRTYDTPFGIIEFIHTKKSREVIEQHTVWDSERGIYRATISLAYADLKHLRRNEGLVDEDELEEALEEEAAA